MKMRVMNMNLMNIFKMGNRFNKCKLFASLSPRREIISEKSFRAVVEVVEYLKLNIDNRNVFRETGQRRRVRQVAACIASGHKNLPTVLLERHPVEVAAGLQFYLLRLQKPLIPKYVQDLALDADDSVQPEVIAADMLGLIRQDLRGRHLYLVVVLLDFLSFLRKHAVNDELAGSNVPFTLLPVFLTLQHFHLQNWRRIANIFMEMVDISPAFLPYPSHHVVHENSHSNATQRIQQRNILMDDINNRQQEEMFREEENVILHQVLIRNGSEGDANVTEIVNVARLRPEVFPEMLNPIFGYFRRRFR